MFKHLLVISCCLFFTACSSPSKKLVRISPPKESHITVEAAKKRAKKVSEVNYHLSFKLDRDNLFYTGTSHINFELAHKDEDLRIDFDRGTVTSLTVNDENSTFIYDKIALYIPPTHLKKGNNTIKIKFKHNYSKNSRGFARFKDPEDDRVYTYTDLEPYEANRVFPCFDQPDIKATYAMMVEAPKNWKLITSVYASKVEKTKNDTKMWYFPKSAKFSTYLWSLHAGPYHKWSSRAGKIPLGLYARQSLKKYVKTKDWFRPTQQGFRFFNKYFDYPYPFKKYDQIIVPEFNSGAMENVAAVTFNEFYVSRGKSSHQDKRRLANVILHEIAHMWFGNLVTMKWWDDLWLNESFATYMAYLALKDSTQYKKKPWRLFNRTKAWAYWEDQLPTTHPILAEVPDTQQAIANFDGITYGKGAAILKQLSFYLGPEKFQKGVQSYFKKYAYKNTTLSDFMESLSEVANINLETWQTLWLKTANVNTVHVSLTCKAGKVETLKFTQTAPRAYNYIRPHRFEVAFLNQKGRSTKVTDTFNVTIDRPEKVITKALGKKCPLLVWPNYNDYGYFKVELDPQTTKTLLSKISSLHNPFVRQMFWHTLWNMVRDGQLKIQTYSKLILENINREFDTVNLRQILGSVVGDYGSVLYYYPKETPVDRTQYHTLVKQWENIAWSRLKKARAKSEHQDIWFSTYIKIARTPEARQNLKALLNRRIKLKKFKINQDRRWKIIKQLSQFGDTQAEALILAEQKQDPSNFGEKHALACHSAIPKAQVKMKWIQELTQDKSTYSFNQLKSVMRNLFPASQADLSKKYSKKLFESLEQVSSKKESYYSSQFARFLIPYECDNQTKGSIQSFIKANANLNPTTVKHLKTIDHESQRCRTIKTLAKSQSAL